jgi:hypothetical protein
MTDGALTTCRPAHAGPVASAASFPKERTMRIKLSIAGLVAVVLAVGAVTLAPAATTNGSSNGGEEVIELFAEEVDSEEIDLAPDGESLGDRFVFTDDLFEEKDGEKVGFDVVECTLVRLDDPGAVQCLATFWLDDRGQITVQGLVTFDGEDSGTFVLPITGGSGEFQNAGGELEVEEVSETEANLTLTVEGTS